MLVSWRFWNIFYVYIKLCSGTALEKEGLGEQSLLLIVIVMPTKKKMNTVISESKCLSLLSQMLILVQKFKAALASCSTSVNCRKKSRKGLAVSSWNVYGNTARKLLWPVKIMLSSGSAEDGLGWGFVLETAFQQTDPENHISCLRLQRLQR